MYRVRKVLNNNAILVIDPKKMQEIIFIGTGIGFNKKTNMEIKIDEKNTTKYIQAPGVDITSQISKNNPIYLEIADAIIQDAKKYFTDFDENILLTLSDHIAFAIKRITNNMIINNPFKNEARLLFPEEYQVACNAKKYIQESCNILVNDDEISYITIHLHSARTDEKVAQSMMLITMVNESIAEIEKTLKLAIDVNSLAYSRLLTHIKYLVARSKLQEKIHIDMNEYTKNAFPTSYLIATNIIKKLIKGLSLKIDDIEIGYLALHIERICNNN
ncbi:MAG: PRD domain-containing protein [Erysipelotrichaceae bacterium]|nr:PRD domain-containing protein [Erysipelotrichaceae bacterium]MDY5252366.1 PRD domain-containing protein [Erysipelotrichaceae bacterium]